MVIHPTALVSPEARLGAHCEIGPYCVIGPGVALGEGCRLLPHAVVLGPSRFGARNVFHPGCVVGAEPQDLKYRGEPTTLEVGDRNVFREAVTVNRGTAGGGGVTRIGSNGLFMACAHVAHDCVVGDHVVLANAVLLGGHVVVEDRAILSGAAAVHHFTTIGTLAFVGGMARVNRDVPPYTLYEGNPAEVKGLNRVGLSRAGLAEGAIESLKAAYRLLFRTDDQTVREGISQLRAGSPTPEVRRLCEFLERTEAGRHGRALEGGH